MKRTVAILGCLSGGTYYFLTDPLPGIQANGEPYQILPKAPESDHPNKHFLTRLPIKTIGIIGGGIAGCIMAKTLTQQGYQVEVIEKNPSFGGLWYKNYDGSGLQFHRDHYNLPDFPFVSKEDFPRSPEVAKYIESYAEKFSIKPYFQFKTVVNDIQQEKNNSWTVKTDKGDKNYDFLVLCTGPYNKPYIPKMRGSDRFKGKIMHSSEFINAEKECVGKRVLVVGSGKSAFDILGQARKYGADVAVVMRKTHWLVPVDLKVFGFPLGHFNSSRLGGLFLDPYYSERSWADKITGFFAPVYWYVIMWFIKKGVPNELMSEESYKKEKHFRGGARDKTIFEDIGEGKIPLYRGSIEEVNSTGARVNGKDIPADLIVFATGFDREFFGLPAEEDGLWLYRNILVPGKKNLAVIGIVNTYCNPLYTNMQAVWLAEVLRGRVCLPSEIKMHEDVNERKAYTRTILSGENTISFSWFPYPTIDQLLTDMGLPIVRKPNRLKYWFEPIKPEDYKEVVTHRE